MTVKREDFSIFLSSRGGQSSSEFTTTLPAPLTLEGNDWEVGISALHYCHNWYSIFKDMEVGLLVSDPNMTASYNIREDLSSLDHSNGVESPEIAHPNDHPVNTPFERSVKQLRDQLGAPHLMLRFGKVIRGNHNDPDKLCQLIESLVKSIVQDDNLGFELKYNSLLRRATIKSRRDITLVADYSNSFIQSLGFIMSANRDYYGFEMRIESLSLITRFPNSNTPRELYGSHEISLNKFYGMYVYSDISEYALVGNSMAPCLAYIPISTKYGEMGHYYQNPPIYHRVNRSIISSIELSLRSHYGEPIPMDGGETTVILHFRRRYRI